MTTDDAPAEESQETQLTFTVKAGNDKKLSVTIAASATVADLKSKLAAPDQADVQPERQRLIYSGRVLKDHDTLASYKIQDGNTVHLVKGAASNARQNPANQASGSTASGSGTPTPQLPTNIAAGTGNNPLAALTGARYAGFHGLPGADMFGPDGGMGPPQDPEAMLRMMEDPNFLQQMNEAMNNPAVIEMLTSNPMVRDNPMLAEMLRNPNMRRILLNPDMMRMQLQMQRSMQGGQRMAAPGVTNTTPQPNTGADAAGSTQQDTTSPSTAPTTDPLASLFGQMGGNPFGQPQQNQGASAGTTSPPPNPFANLFGPPPSGTGSDGQQQQNPIAEMTRQLMQNPEAMRNIMNMAGMGGMGGAAYPGTGAGAGTGSAGSPPPNPFAALFGPGGMGGGAFGSGFGSPAPQDTRPHEEVYEVQLRQLNEMGFYEFERNVAALRRSGGNVQGAVEYLLNGSV